MITLTIPGQSRSVSFPAPWSNVTLGQYARMQGKHQLEQVAILAGVEFSEIEALTDTEKEVLMIAMDAMGPIQEQPLDFPGNLGLESIGKFELAKKFVQQFQDEDDEILLWDVAPYILAIYLWATEEDVKRGFYAGFPVPLVDKAKAMPITQAIGAVVFFFSELSRITAAFAPVLNREPDADELAAGVDRFEKYGFFSSIVSICGGKPWKYNKLLLTPTEQYYMTQAVLVEQEDYRKQYQEVTNPKSTI